MKGPSFTTRLILFVLIAAGSTVVLLHAAASSLLERLVLQSEMENLSGSCEAGATLLRGIARDPESLDSTLRQLHPLGDRSLEILDRNMGTIFPQGITPASARVGPENLEKLAGLSPEGVRTRLVEPRGSPALLLAMTPLDQGTWLLLTRDMKAIRDRQAGLTSMLTIISSLAWLLVAVLGFFLLRRWVLKPVNQLISLARKVSTGQARADQDPAPLFTPGDDLGFMEHTLREMAERIRADREEITSRLAQLEDLNSQLTEAREQLVRTEILASVGRLAAGVAHEIGNPVGIILGYLEVLEEDSTDPQIRTILARIREATTRIDTTIRDLLDFSRPTLDEEQTCDPEAATREVLALLRPQKRFRTVKLHLVSPQAEVRVGVPPSRFKQILVNLLLNAADAMDQTPQAQVTISFDRDDLRVRVSVSDNGPGIPQDALSRLFEPFFTTKGPGHGTGLGLFMAHQVLQRYNSGISVMSSPDRGTTFTLELPPAGGIAKR